jgi:hypothetical protein
MQRDKLRGSALSPTIPFVLRMLRERNCFGDEAIFREGGYQRRYQTERNSPNLGGSIPCIPADSLPPNSPGAAHNPFAQHAPVLLEDGEALFEGVEDPGLEPVDVIHSPKATHVTYRVVR